MWIFRKLTNKQAFTLLEILVSFMLLSLILHSIQSVYHHYVSLDERVRTDKEAAFLHFVSVLEAEVNHYQVSSVERQRINLWHADEKKTYQILPYNQKLIKSPGHQILLYEVQGWELALNGNHLQVALQFVNGQAFTASLIVPIKEVVP